MSAMGKKKGRIKFTRRVRRNAVSVIVIAIIFLVILAIAYPIANQASNTARKVFLVVWGTLLGLSYLAFTIWAIIEYKLNSIDVNKVENKLLKKKRKKLLKEAISRAEEKGETLSDEERQRIEDGYYDWSGLSY